MKVTGTAFRSVAGDYERGRPGYPPAALDHLVRELGLRPGSTVLDLGAGTGKLTRDLVRRFRRVIAVEPLDEMRAVIERSLPSVETARGTAERIPLDARGVDAVFVGQAFHWFDGRRALAEIARVLRSGGGLALIWNSTPWESREGPWFAALDDVLERSRADLSTMRRHATGMWRRAFEAERRFEPLREATFPNPQRASGEEFIASLASRSYVAAMGEGDRAELLAEVNRLLERPEAPLDGDAVVLRLRADVYWTRLRR